MAGLGTAQLVKWIRAMSSIDVAEDKLGMRDVKVVRGARSGGATHQGV